MKVCSHQRGLTSPLWKRRQKHRRHMSFEHVDLGECETEADYVVSRQEILKELLKTNLINKPTTKSLHDKNSLQIQSLYTSEHGRRLSVRGTRARLSFP